MEIVTYTKGYMRLTMWTNNNYCCHKNGTLKANKSIEGRIIHSRPCEYYALANNCFNKILSKDIRYYYFCNIREYFCNTLCI